MTLLLRRSGRTRRTRDVTQRRGLVRCWKWWLLLGIVVYAVVGSVVGWIALRWPSTTPTTAGKEKDKNHIHHTPSTILWHAFWDAAPNSHNAADEAPLPKEAPSRTIPSVLDEVEDRRCVWNRLRQAGVSESILQQHQDQLPTWTAVTKQYGDHPVILGLHSCAVYQTRVPPERRMLGAAGMFSTGTNLVTQLLKHNCAIPERLALYGPNATKEQLGMRWQVPWGKHTPAQYKWKHATKQASDIRKEDVLPVVTVRNPWRWMQSMCKNPYAAHWSHYHQCPNLKDPATERNWNQVTVKFGAATEIYQSLPHLWNDWYNDYLKASEPTFSNDRDERHYPWIMVRMEDLVFHTVETVTDVCECAGGRLYEDRPFHYITDSAKADSPGHDTSTGIAEAWIKYSQPLRAGAGFTPSDYASALEAIDQKIMDHLHYHHPPPAAALDQR